MASPFTIGKLASTAGVPTSTVRYYERSGLIRPDGRTGGNYRLYGAEALERLRFIRTAQASGFTLQDVAALLDLWDGTTNPCREVQELIERRLLETKKRMADLRKLENVLKSFLQLCRRSERDGKCEVINTIRLTSSSPSPVRTRRPRAKKLEKRP